MSNQATFNEATDIQKPDGKPLGEIVRLMEVVKLERGEASECVRITMCGMDDGEDSEFIDDQVAVEVFEDSARRLGVGQLVHLVICPIVD